MLGCSKPSQDVSSAARGCRGTSARRTFPSTRLRLRAASALAVPLLAARMDIVTSRLINLLNHLPYGGRILLEKVKKYSR